MYVADLIGTYSKGCYSFQGLDDWVGGGEGSQWDIGRLDGVTA